MDASKKEQVQTAPPEQKEKQHGEHSPKELFNMVCESMKMSGKELEEYSRKNGIGIMTLLEWRKNFTNPFKLMNKIIQEQARAKENPGATDNAKPKEESSPTSYLRGKLEEAWNGKEKG